MYKRKLHKTFPTVLKLQPILIAVFKISVRLSYKLSYEKVTVSEMVIAKRNGIKYIKDKRNRKTMTLEKEAGSRVTAAERRVRDKEI